MEPSRPDLRRGTAAGSRELKASELHLGAAAGAATLALSSSGEVVLLVALLGVAAADVVSAAVAALALGAVAVRWGAVSLEAIAGAQAVLGPGAAVGPVGAAASIWCAAAALLLVRARGWGAPAFGIVAGLVFAGPAATGAGALALRAAAAVVGALVAVEVRRRASRIARPLAVGLGVTALILALALPT